MLIRFTLIYLFAPHIQALLRPLTLRFTKYSVTEAKFLLHLAAGAYSSDPEKCVLKSLSKEEQWSFQSTVSRKCDVFQNSCLFYILRSDIAQRFIIVFRGTIKNTQLMVEGWQSLARRKDFFGVGLVNRYFFQALNKLWPNIEPVLKDSTFKMYGITFTGHSLGGALASLAATRTVIENLRTGKQIRLVTFGQPRTGDYQFALYHNAHISYSFRLINGHDIVPHLPPCSKNKSCNSTAESKSKPCVEKNGFSYHHGIEIWYPNGMSDAEQYVECLGKPRSEDFNCSDGLKFHMNQYKRCIKDHRHYFNISVSLR
uniref:Fungal lipase-like domain-containing protein n=1 Tax=Setaria digitata TaxID=48799 RepID=A0A915PJ24_9BILA